MLFVWISIQIVYKGSGTCGTEVMQNFFFDVSISAILAGVHSYFVVSSFKCEGNNSCHDLIHNPLLQCVRTTSAILAGTHFYFVVSSFKCEGNNSCHDLIPNRRKMK